MQIKKSHLEKEVNKTGLNLIKCVLEMCGKCTSSLTVLHDLKGLGSIFRGSQNGDVIAILVKVKPLIFLTAPFEDGIQE